MHSSKTIKFQNQSQLSGIDHHYLNTLLKLRGSLSTEVMSAATIHRDRISGILLRRVLKAEKETCAFIPDK